MEFLKFKIISVNFFKEKEMNKQLDKETKKHQEFYNNFLKYTTYTTISVIVIVALMAIFLV